MVGVLAEKKAPMYFPVNAALIALYQGGKAKYFTFWLSKRKPEIVMGNEAW